MEFHGRVSALPLLTTEDHAAHDRATSYVSPRHSQLSEPALDTPDSVHCSSLLGKSDDVDSIEVLKTALGIRFEYHHPWWFRLAGGGWNTASGYWTAWAAFYSVAVFIYSGFQTVVTLTEEDSVHGTEVIVTPDVKSTIKGMQKVVTVLGFLTHSFLQIQIIRCVGNADSMSRHSSHARGLFACTRGWSWCELRLEASSTSRILAAPSLGCVAFLVMASTFLVVGNVVDPGDYNTPFNVFVWGFFGAFFGWYPYVCVSTMFATDCITQMRCLHSLQVIVRTKSFEDAHLAYFTYYNTMRMNVKSYKTTLLVQIVYLLTAVLCNSITILAQHDPGNSGRPGNKEYRVLALCIATLCFFQCVYPVIYAGVVNLRADKLRRAIAKQPRLHLLLDATAVCHPGVEIGSFTVSLSRFAVLSLTYLGIIFVGWIKNVSGWGGNSD